MNLVIFDIDGTVVNSISADDDCFIQTFRDLYQIDLFGSDWNDFEHVTDSGLTREIFLNHVGRLPTANEIDKTQDYFFDLILSKVSEFEEIPGASEFIKKLVQLPNVLVAFATGGWRKTALLKLQCLNLPIDNYVLMSADDHFKRTEITKLAIQAAVEKHEVRTLESITYFGDGLWDFKASEELNIEFIGVDYKETGRLKAFGARRVLGHYREADESLIITKARL